MARKRGRGGLNKSPRRVPSSNVPVQNSPPELESRRHDTQVRLFFTFFVW